MTEPVEKKPTVSKSFVRLAAVFLVKMILTAIPIIFIGFAFAFGACLYLPQC